MSPWFWTQVFNALLAVTVIGCAIAATYVQRKGKRK